MRSQIKWLLVDIGDVLIVRNKDNYKSFAELLVEELGINLELAQEINKVHYTTMEEEFVSENEFVADLKEKLNYDAPKDIFSYFERAYDTQRLPNTTFINFLDDVRAKGVKTGILSNTVAIYAPIQKRMGISNDGGFDPIIYSWDVQLKKPNKEIFELALEKLNASPDEVVFIDDKAEHLEGAQQAGLVTLLFENTNDAMKEIRQLLVMQK